MGQPQLHPDMAPLEAALKCGIREHGCPYSQNAGFVELRAAIAQHFAYPGLRSPEQVCITIGSQEALYLPIKALLDPSLHEALVVTPTFPAYQKLCHIEGIRVVEVQLDPKKTLRLTLRPFCRRLRIARGWLRLHHRAIPTGRCGGIELRKLGADFLHCRSRRICCRTKCMPSCILPSRDRPRRLRFIPHHRGIVAVKELCPDRTAGSGWIMAPRPPRVMWKSASVCGVVCRYLCAARCD